MSYPAELVGTQLHEMAVELAEQFTDDFQTQEEFIDGFVWAVLSVSSASREGDE